MSTNNDPRWALVAMAFDSAPNARDGAAAVLRVIADEVVPFKLSPGGYRPECDHEHAAWAERQRIRQHLRAEADRAEVGR